MFLTVIRILDCYISATEAEKPNGIHLISFEQVARQPSNPSSRQNNGGHLYNISARSDKYSHGAVYIMENKTKNPQKWHIKDVYDDVTISDKGTTLPYDRPINPNNYYCLKYVCDDGNVYYSDPMQAKPDGTFEKVEGLEKEKAEKDPKKAKKNFASSILYGPVLLLMTMFCPF